MSFVTIAVGTARRSRVRTLSARALWAASALAALALLAAGAGVGHWATRIATAQPADPAKPQARPLITVEQLGSLSARLVLLERQASQLRQRLGLAGARPAAALASAPAASTTAPAAAPDAVAPTGVDPKPGRGGPMLPPRSEAEAALAEPGDEAAQHGLESRLGQLEQQLALLADAALAEGLARMRVPSWLPIGAAALVSGFGNRSDPLTGRHAFHEGLDFAAPSGTPIRAAAGGKVRFAGFRPDFGWMVEVDHGNALVTRYAHASRLEVRSGDIVTPGERIAAVGSTGRSTGPHLHFELLRQGDAVDPRRYLAGL